MIKRRCTCGCVMTVQRIKTPNAYMVRYVCFVCRRTSRRFLMRGKVKRDAR